MEQPGELEKLAKAALKSASFIKRKEALQELAKYDSPRAVEVLEDASANDVNRGVRELAQSLLAARQGAALVQPDMPAAPATPAPVSIPTEPPWQCDSCGMENTGGDTCYYCRAARPGYDTELFEFPEVVPTAPESEVFLLNPGNRAFVAGQSKRLASTGYGCVMLVFIPFLIVGLFFLGYGIKSLIEWQQLTTEGVTTRGKFIDRSISYDSDDDESYYVTFQFGLNNQTHVVEQNVDSGTYDRAETGAPVDIVYVPDNPTLARVAGTESSPVDLFIMAFSLCWNVFVWLVLLAIIGGWRKRRALQRSGQLTRGEVVSCSGRNSNKGGYIITVEYRFNPPDGGAMIANKQTENRRDLRDQPLPTAGTPLAILYRDRKTYTAL
jgi:hypothetical protein